ncbi:MAG: hypothetical protein QMC36_06220 [Patescibacteria group bacterium]
MLYSKIGSRNASDVVVEVGLGLLAVGAIAFNPSLVLVPAMLFFGSISVVLPFVALAVLSMKKSDSVTGVLVLAGIILTEVWCYFLFQVAHHAQYGAEYVLFPK